MDVGIIYGFLVSIFSCFKAFICRWWWNFIIVGVIVLLLKVQKSTEDDLGLSVVLWFVVVIALYYLVTFLCFLISYSLSLGRIIVPIEKLANLPQYKDVQLKYHLFISIHDKDYPNLKDFIAELESRGLQLFVTCIDITPGESMISATATAITQSALYMVVASAEYLKETELNHFQIGTFLSKSTPKDFLVFKHNECSVSEIFGKRFQLVDATKVTRHEAIQAVNNWINSHLYLKLRRVTLTLIILFGVIILNIWFMAMIINTGWDGEPLLLMLVWNLELPPLMLMLIILAIDVLVLVVSIKLIRSFGISLKMFLSAFVSRKHFWRLNNVLALNALGFDRDELKLQVESFNKN